MKKPKNQSEIEPATFQLVAQYLNNGVTYVIPLPVYTDVSQNIVTHVTAIVRFTLRFTPRPALGSTQPPIRWGVVGVVRGFFPGGRAAGA